MGNPEQSKFKYILSPENTYILDYGDFTAEVKGSEIMSFLRRQYYLENLLQDLDKDNLPE
jgi:hypothetical protein